MVNGIDLLFLFLLKKMKNKKPPPKKQTLKYVTDFYTKGADFPKKGEKVYLKNWAWPTKPNSSYSFPIMLFLNTATWNSK